MEKLHRSIACRSLVALAICAASLAASRPARAIAVTTVEDELNADGDCSLREAIQSANSGALQDGCTMGTGLIVVSLPAGTFTLALAGAGEDLGATGDLDVLSVLELTGAGEGATFVDGGLLDRVLEVHAGAWVTACGLTLSGGRVADGAEAEGGCVANRGTLTLTAVRLDGCAAVRTVSGGPLPRGGGVYNSGHLEMTRVEIVGNLADAPDFQDAAAGGGLYNDGMTASVMATDSTLRDNGAGRLDFANARGGGIFNAGGLVNLVRSTVSGNRAGGQSPGSSWGGGIYNDGGQVALLNSTVSGNVSEGGISFAGGIASVGGPTAILSLVSSTVAGNATPDMNQSDNLYVGGGMVSLVSTIVAGGPDNCSGVADRYQGGFNLESPSDVCGFDGPGDQVAVPAELLALGALALNPPGITATRALGAGSVAIGAGATADCPDTDQRGVPRDAACDVGAYEWQPDGTIFADGFESGDGTAWDVLIP